MCFYVNERVKETNDETGRVKLGTVVKEVHNINKRGFISHNNTCKIYVQWDAGSRHIHSPSELEAHDSD